MRKQLLLALFSTVLLSMTYFTYRAFVVEKIEEDLRLISISTPLSSVGYFIEQIGGQHVRVHSLLSDGQSYHNLELTPSQVKTLNGSQAFFTLNTPEEMPLVEKLKGCKVQIFDLSSGLTLLPFTDGGQCKLVSESKVNWDPHVWLGISNMAILAENISLFLSQLDPVHSEVFQENLTKLQLRLQDLWQRTQQTLAPYKDSCVLVLHASYGYFLQPFALTQISLESFQKESSVKQMTEALHKAKNCGARFLFVSARENPRQVQELAKQFGLKVIIFEPVFKEPFVEINNVLQAIADCAE